MRHLRRVGLAILCLYAASVRLPAQGTLADYRRAATVGQRVAGLTGDVAESPTWIGTTRFTYRKSVKGGNQFVLVDAATGDKRAPFDHARLAAALTAAASPRMAYTAITLPFRDFSLVNNDAAVDVDANGSRWRCTLADYACTRTGAALAPDLTVGGFGGGRGAGAAGAGPANAGRWRATAGV